MNETFDLIYSAVTVRDLRGEEAAKRFLLEQYGIDANAPCPPNRENIWSAIQSVQFKPIALA
jgi:hypothetical protein